MSTPFELPIYYLENKEPLDENIKTDLELLEVNQDSESRKSLLQTVMNPQSKIGNQYLHKLCEYYTDDKSFLKETKT